MKGFLSIVAVIAALPVGVAVAGVTGGDGGGGQPPPCKPSPWHKCPPPTKTVTVTVTGPTTTVTKTVTDTQTVTEPGTTVTEPGTTVTVPAPPAPAPIVTVTQGPVTNTVNVTITINGVPQTVTVPGTMPGQLPACVNTRKSAVLGPLPLQFKTGMRVSLTSNGHTQFSTVMAGRRVNVNTSNLPCGVYPIAIRHPGLKTAWRIWSFTGGNRLTRFWFPGLKGVSNF